MDKSIFRSAPMTGLKVPPPPYQTTTEVPNVPAPAYDPMLVGLLVFNMFLLIVAIGFALSKR